MPRLLRRSNSFASMVNLGAPGVCLGPFAYYGHKNRRQTFAQEGMVLLKRWKKTLTSVFLISAALVLVAFWAVVYLSTLPGFVKVLLCVLGAVELVCLLLFAVAHIYSLRHESGVLAAGPDGRIAIEYSALRSVAAYSLKGLDGVNVLKVSPKVVRKGDTSFVDFNIEVSAVSEATMSSAASMIQKCVKANVEPFCETQVRNVNVHFRLPKKAQAKPSRSKIKGLLEELSTQD